MSKMNRFFAKVGRGFKKFGAKVENTYDNAADSVRAKGLEIRIDEQYENLGRVVYRDLHTDEDLEQTKLEIIAKIDALFDELEQIKEAKQARRTPEKAAEAVVEAPAVVEVAVEEAAVEAVVEEAAEDPNKVKEAAVDAEAEAQA